MPVDTVISNGTIVTSESVFDGAIAIDDGTIVGVGNEETLPEASTTIDASDRLVMPGVVDPHTHIDDHVSLDSYESATSAAALGGVTSLIDFGWQAYVSEDSAWDEESTIREGVERKREKAENPVIDFSLHGGFLREGEDAFDEL